MEPAEFLLARLGSAQTGLSTAEARARLAPARGDWVDASIIMAIVLGSGLLGFVQEHRASQAVGRLRAQLALRSTVLRDGAEQ